MWLHCIALYCTALLLRATTAAVMRTGAHECMHGLCNLHGMESDVFLSMQAHALSMEEQLHEASATYKNVLQVTCVPHSLADMLIPIGNWTCAVA